MTSAINPDWARGIDVSDWQGPDFDWGAWDGHIDYALIKATEGPSIIDPDFARNWATARDVVGVRLAYHYARPGQSDPIVQARRLTDVARAAGMGQFDHFALDYEDAGGLDPVTASFWAWTFCTEVNRLNPGHRILVYTYPDFADRGYCAKLGPWALWLANWGVRAPEIPTGPWNSWRIWQTSAIGYGNDLFHGTDDDLHAYFSHAG